MSYEEQRMAELAYAEEYRRLIRSKRSERGTSADVTADSSAEGERTEREVTDAVEREREAARERRRQTMDLFARASGAYATPETSGDTESESNTEDATRGGGSPEGEDASWEPIERREPESRRAPGTPTHSADEGKIYVDSGVRVHRLFVDGTTLDNIGVDISGGAFTSDGEGYSAPAGTTPLQTEPEYTPVGSVKHNEFDAFFSAYDNEPCADSTTEEDYGSSADGISSQDYIDEDAYDFEPITRSTEPRAGVSTGSVKSGDVFYSPIADFDAMNDGDFAFIPDTGAEFEPEYGKNEQTAPRRTDGEGIYEDEAYRRFLERERQRNGCGEAGSSTYAEPIADDYEELDGEYSSNAASSAGQEREMPRDYRPQSAAERYRPEQYSDGRGGAHYGYDADTAVSAEDYSSPRESSPADESRDMAAFIDYYREQQGERGGSAQRDYRTDAYADTAVDEHSLDDFAQAATDDEYDVFDSRGDETILDGASTRRQMQKEMDELLARDRRERRERSKTKDTTAGTRVPDVSGEIAPYNKTVLNKKKKSESDADIATVKARIESQMSAIRSELDREELSFTSRTGKEKRLLRKKKHELKRLRALLARAVKYENQDNERYYSLVLADIPRMKLPRGADMTTFVDTREKLVQLLAARDALNRRLCELYGYTAGGTGSIRDKVKHTAMRKEHNKQAKFVGRLRRARVDYEIRRLVGEVVDEQVALRGEIAECEYSLRREKPKGAAKRQLTARLKDAKRKYARNEKQLVHISRTALDKAKDRSSRKRAATWAWIGLGLVAVLALVVWWQWDNIVGLILAYFPTLGTLAPQ